MPDVTVRAIDEMEPIFGGVARRARAELGVTAGAVSQSVRALEYRIGAALFVRRPQSLAPTRAACELLPVLTEAFDAVDAALRRIQAPAATAAQP